MIANQDHFNFFITQIPFFKTIHDLETCFIFVIAFYHSHHPSVVRRNIDRVMISMCGSENGNIPLCLCPGGCIGGMRMYNASNLFPMFI